MLKKHGLSIDSDILKAMSEEKVAKIIKSDFELMIQGTTSLSSGQYKQVAKEVQRVYEELAIDEEK